MTAAITLLALVVLGVYWWLETTVVADDQSRFT